MPLTDPYLRIDALEQDARQKGLIIAQLAGKLAELSASFAALCIALGQNAEALPGEKAMAPDRERAKPKGSH